MNKPMMYRNPKLKQSMKKATPVVPANLIQQPVKTPANVKGLSRMAHGKHSKKLA